MIHHPYVTPARVVERHPSHLHINLLPRLQGRGLGRRLMDRWLARMSEFGSPGVHLGVGALNARGRVFYEAYGFTLLEENARTAWYGLAL
jgi:ribosomal protein S18 acetylase RimI-like enzyme